MLERILEERMVKNLLNLMKNVRPLNRESKLQVGSTQRDLTPRYIIIKTILKAAKARDLADIRDPQKAFGLSNSSAGNPDIQGLKERVSTSNSNKTILKH